MNDRKQPVCSSCPQARFHLEGELGRRLEAVTRQWILPAPHANPVLLEMFRNRDRQPYPDQVPWAGEFAGKYLTHAVQIYRLTRDRALFAQLQWFVSEFLALQAKDGYLGAWPEPWRLRRGAPKCAEPWDAWGHYHAMLGLLLWHEETGDKAALKGVRRMADLMCRRFLEGQPEKMHDAGAHEMNQAPIHTLAWLHRLTGEPRYLAMARTIEREFEIPPAGDYLRTALAGKEFYQTPKPRWESLHPILGLVELYYATGEDRYRQAFEHLWWSMLKGDRHNNGGFTSGEKATGNPYQPGAIETCCTVAWMAMSVEMLRLTGDSRVADELELSLFNSGFGMMSPSGRWVTYDTPMDGPRLASAHSIVFQSRAGSPELNCCSVNGPRALGLTGEWAILRRAEGLVLNYYGPGRMEIPLASGLRVAVIQKTDYPRARTVDLTIQPGKAREFPIWLRIPAWSARTGVAVNGRAIRPVPAGRYLEITRVWRPGDRIRLVLDFRPHLWVAGPDEGWGAKNLERPWQLFGPAPRPEADVAIQRAPAYATEPGLEGLTRIPDELRIHGVAYRPVPAVSREGILAGRDLFPDVGGQPLLVGMTEWEVAEEQEITLYFTADWWTTWYLNGETVYDNHGTPGNTGDFLTRNNRVTLRLRPGRNVLAFRLSGGIQRGCWISMGRGLLAEEIRQRSEYLARASLYRGPILLALDPRYQEELEERLPTLDARAVKSLKAVKPGTWLKPWMLFEVRDVGGRKVRLCDFGSAGLAGQFCRSWLTVRLPEPLTDRFSRDNPLRSSRVE